MDLELLKWDIINRIDPNWSNLEIIRFVYIEAGKVLQKHTEFFLTVEDKMSFKPLTARKLDRIYEGKNKVSEWNKMVCKSACSFLKSIYDELGIDSKLVKTIDGDKRPGMKNEIRHYFLCVNDGNNNYFLGPTSDFAYIQNGMETKHFATDISFLITGPGGKKIKYYDAEEEIPHVNLNSIELKKIDSKIGYLTSYSKSTKQTKEAYIDEIIRESKDMYIDYLSENTDFYNSIMPIEDNKKIGTSFLEITKDQWLQLINKICSQVGNRICEFVSKDYNFSNKITSEEELEEWINYISKQFNPKDYNTRELIYKNPNLLFNKTKTLCKTMLKFYDTEKHISTFKEDVISFRNTYIRMLREISKHFIDEKMLREPKEKNNYVSSQYLNARFSTMFPYVFNCNEGFTNSFNHFAYSEQIEIIKYIIQLMFNDLDDKVLLKEENDIKVKPLFRRINIYSAKEKRGNNYGCYFSINDVDSKNGNIAKYWYVFDIDNNTFRKTTPTEIIINCSKNGKYELLSNRLRSYLSHLETAGEEESKKNKGL